MELEPPQAPPFINPEEPELCGECKSGSRLANGLCLNCLLRSALDDEDVPLETEAFKEALAAVKSRDGDWSIGEHEILDEIARGGMGVIYRAREPHSGRIVALKCILAYQGDSDEALARFRREAETVARLDHPNIVPNYQVGETADGLPYFTMKYAAAGSLLQARAPLVQHPRQSAALMVKVARAVHYAHEQGVLHRDLKPGNILLDSHGEPLVSDFGLARCEAVSSYLTRSLASFGTPGYIAPEQADGPAANLTRAADVYSLGAILFELLTGRLPFVGDNAFAVMKQSAEQPAPKLRSLSPKADRDLEVICARCLEREPGDRYQSAKELAGDLQSWLDDRPIAASPLSPSLRARRWIRRNRTLAASLAALALLGTGALFWQIRARKTQTAMRENLLAMRSVAVLPFLDLDTVAGDEAATGYVADLLKRKLESLGPARVSTNSQPGWAKLEDIQTAAREAKGRAVLTGTVRNVEGTRHISIRLLDPASGMTLFSTALEQKEGQEVSSGQGAQWVRDVYKIVSADGWPSTPSDPGVRNQKANDAISSGRAWMESYTVFHLDQAIARFKEAVAIEPDSSLAHSYLAIAATGRTHFVADWSYLELGRAEALKALALDPSSVVAHRALSGVYYQEGKFQEALEELMRTIEIGGVDVKVTCFLGSILDLLGRPDRALSWYQVASKLHNRPGETELQMGDIRAKLAEDEQAFRAYDRASELQPGSSRGAMGRARLHSLRGEVEPAREICINRLRDNELGEMAQAAAQIEFFARNYPAAEELYTKLAKGDKQGGGSFFGGVTYQSALGRIKQVLGSNEIATGLLQESFAKERATLNRQPANPEAAYRLAAVEASLNLTEAALQHLRLAVTLGWLDYRSLQKDPRFDSLRANPELDTLIDGLSAKVAELRSKTKKE